MPPIALLVALSDPTRCRIVEILHKGPQPVHVLAASFDISRPAISRHLRVLKQAKLISEKKSGRENRYAMHAKALRPVTKWLEQFATVAHVAEGTPDIQVNRKPAAIKRADPTPPAGPARLPASQMGFDF